MIHFVYKIAGSDVTDYVSQYVSPSKIPVVARTRDGELQSPSITFGIQTDCSVTPARNDAVLIEYNSVTVFYGYIDVIEELKDTKTYKIIANHQFAKLKDYELNSTVLGALIEAGTSDQYLDAGFFDGYVQAIWLVECILDLINGAYSITISNTVKQTKIYGSATLELQDVYLSYQYLYLTLNGSDPPNCFDYLSKLCKTLGLVIYFYDDDFTVDLLVRLSNTSISNDDIKPKGDQPRDYYPEYNNARVNASIAWDLSDVFAETIKDSDTSKTVYFDENLYTNFYFFSDSVKSTLLLNGDLEDWSGGNPDDWDTGGTVTEDNTYYYEGSASALLEDSDNGYIQQEVSLSLTKGGRTKYSLYYMNRTDQTLNPILNIQFEYYDGTWHDLENTNYAGTDAGVWEQETSNYVYPVGTTKLRLKIRAIGTYDNTYVDNVELFVEELLLYEYSEEVYALYCQNYSIDRYNKIGIDFTVGKSYEHYVNPILSDQSTYIMREG